MKLGRCVLVAALGVAAGVWPGHEQVATAEVASARMVPVEPARLVDTRSSGTRVARLVVPVAGRAGVPAAATAVAINVTATQASGPGYVTVFPAGQARPLASNLNIERAGQTLANLVVVPVGVDGAVEVFSAVDVHLIIDVTAAWVPASTATSGRLIAESPRRLIDTRLTSIVPPSGTLSVAVPAGAAAVAVNLTVTQATGSGFFTAYPTGSARPLASNLNIERVGQTVANLVIVPVGAATSSIDVYSAAGGHIIVDLVGSFTGANGAAGVDGLFVPNSPRRLLDTRVGAPSQRLVGGVARSLTVGPGAAAFLNVTATEASRPGYLSAWPAGTPAPDTSTLNVDRSWQTIANLSLVRLGRGGQVNLLAARTGHVVVDLGGIFLGPPAPDAGVDNPSTSGATPSSDGILRESFVIGGSISPKSVVASGGGLMFAQNMMYNHSITVYDRDGRLLRTIDDNVGGVAGAPVEAAAHPNGRWMYVSNYSMYGAGQEAEGFDACSPVSRVGASTVYRVDVASLTIDQVIPVGRVPKYLAMSPDGATLVVTNWCDWDVSIIDTSTGKEVRRSPQLGRYPRGIAISPDSTTAYIALMGQGEVVAVDLASGAVSRRIANVGGGPRHLNLSPDGRTLYVTLNEDGGVARMDVATGIVTARVATGVQVRSAALAADGRHMFVVNYESGTASKILTDTMAVVQVVPTSFHPIGITYDDEARQLWVSCYVGRIHVFDNI